MIKTTRLHRPLTLALGLTTAFVLASCSQTDSAPTTSTPAPVATTPSAAPSTSAPTAHTEHSTAPSTPAGRRIDISVTGKRVTPAPATVNIAVGESLTIAVTSDHDDTLHSHGFDIEKDIKAGRQATITIKGAQPGVYEVELHEPELRILQVAVR